MLNVYLPYAKSLITQRFGENDNGLYASQGLKGHTAYDWGASWGTPVPCCVPDSFCYAVLNKDAKDLTKFRGVYTIAKDDTGNYFEVMYGHFSDIFAVEGQTYQVGDIIANVGNTGAVYVNGREVSLAEKLAGSHAGAHLHGPQVRPIERVAKRTGRVLLMDEKGPYRDVEGYWYEIIDYSNGYNGCISLAPFSTETLATSYKALKIAQDTVGAVAEQVSHYDELPVDSRPGIVKAWVALLQSIAKLLRG